MSKTNAGSHSNHKFSQVPNAEIPRSKFDRSCGYKTTFDSGFLVPVFLDEALPGDTFNCHMTAFARLATPIFPFMDNMFMDTFFFAVPYRLVWDNWQKFNGEQRNPGDSTSFLVPVLDKTKAPLNAAGFPANSISDYFGLPTLTPGIAPVSLWHRAYNLIWNEWFRDENLQQSVTVPVTDGPDDPALFTLLRRGKRHDYFTSALPWPQKGPAVSIPLSGNAPIVSPSPTTPLVLQRTSGTAMTNGAISYDASTNKFYPATGGSATTGPMRYESGLQADLSAVTAATINALRQAFQIQKLYERDARGGTRYTEIIRAHFGVTSPDARLQRPEYLGGGSTPININPIAQTSAVPSQPSPLGNLAAMGTASVHNHGFTKSFTEHTLIIGLVSVRADLSYQQGLDRMFSRSTRFDFYWPALSHIGEQAVLNQEIYCQGSANPTQDAAVFGYQERYAEYRYKPSKITGQFRSNFPQTLDAWHLAQKFTALPTLSSAFIQENPPVARVIAVPTEPQFLFDSYFKNITARPMPVYSVPGYIDHF
ncbi:MAG: major capsid protein [Microviridae sp.]|nr:MAG: major capsid protein [Microviridae sp.]